MESFSLLMLDGYGATTLMITLFMWMAGLPFCEGGGEYVLPTYCRKVLLLEDFFYCRKVLLLEDAMDG